MSIKNYRSNYIAPPLYNLCNVPVERRVYTLGSLLGWLLFRFLIESCAIQVTRRDTCPRYVSCLTTVRVYFQCDYNLLCLKRHEKSSFMPGTYVFPGGNVDPADSDLKWHELFAAFGFDNRHFVSLVPKAAVRPQILKSQRNELSRDISLRITAIRETFEECGVLMCRRRDDRALSVWAQHLSGKKLSYVRGSICSERIIFHIFSSLQFLKRSCKHGGEEFATMPQNF